MTSKYTSKLGYELEGAVCPYCEKKHQIEAEDYSEELEEIECDCGKKFYCSQHASISHYSRPDCELNDEEHQYKEFKKDVFYCEICENVELKRGLERKNEK